MDSPGRQPVPQFGAWRDYGPDSPTIDYSQAFARARASRLGSMPTRNENRDEDSIDETAAAETTSAHPPNRFVVVRNSSRRNFLQFFVCGSRRAQAVA